MPLTVQDRVLGAITLATAESGRRYDETDLLFAEELGRRAATAIENARLYRMADERAQASRVLEAVADAVVLVDREGIVRLWNPAAARITGFGLDDVLGRPIADVVPGWEQLAQRIPVSEDPGTGRAETTPVELGGRELWISGSGVALDEGVVYAFRDLTEERALEQMRSDFVATVSHELRTPLAAIYGAALTIRRPDLELDDELHDHLLQVIADESDRLASIVEDLLIASHLDSGKLRLAIADCDPADLVAGVVEAAETPRPEQRPARRPGRAGAPTRARRPEPAQAGDRQPRRQRGQVLARRRRGARGGRGERRDGALLGERHAGSGSRRASSGGSSRSSIASTRT